MGKGTSFLKRTLVVASAVLLAIVGSWWALRRYAESMPSYQRARATVTQLVFIEGRILLRTEISQIFVSDDNGKAWRRTSENAPSLAVANGHDVWAARGWPGIHEGPSASIWRSSDRAETWEKKDVELPGGRSEGLFGRLPAAFINDPNDAPLLIMSDFQLVRPELIADSSTWKRIGRRIRDDTVDGGTVNPRIAGRQYGRSMYVASAGHIFFSSDEGTTWLDQVVRPFFDAKIRCAGATCYALVSELGSAGNELLLTVAHTNEWKTVSTFDLGAVALALSAERWRGKIDTFGACAMLPTSKEVYIAGIINAGKDAWGAVLSVAPDGSLTSVGHGVPHGLWVLESAPDGSLWAGGQGAYRLKDGEWISAWTVPG